MFESLVENIIPSDLKPSTKLKKVIHHFSDSSSSEDENIKPRSSKDSKVSSSSSSPPPLPSSSFSISKSTEKVKQSIIIPRKSTLTAKDEMRKSLIYNTVSDIEELKSRRLARFRIPMVNNLIDSFVSSSDDEEPRTSGRNKRKESKESRSEGEEEGNQIEPKEKEAETNNKQKKKTKKKKNQYLRSFDDDTSSDESG